MANRKPRDPAAAAAAGDAAPVPRLGGAHLDYGSLRDALGYLIHLADLANMQGFARVFGDTGVTAARFTALELIACNPGIKPTALAAAMAVERSNLATLIRYLASRGWVAAGAGSNRREKALQLTPAGAAMLVDLRERLQRHDQELSARCSRQERAQLARLLAKIVGAMPAATSGAFPDL
ncbi:MAG: MarR family winged helix-turn-helix transcriptional regulator [Burkholderiaceae bacterium]